MSDSKKQLKEQRRTFWQPPEERDRISEDGKRWQEDNAEVIKAWNDWVDKNGLPLAEYRPF